MLLKAELFFPNIKYHRLAKLFQNLQILSFIDFGYTYDVDKTLISKDTVFMASLGPALKYYLRKNFQVSFAYGFQLKTVLRKDELRTRHSRGRISASLSF